MVAETFSRSTVPVMQTIMAGQDAWGRIKSSPRQRQNYRDWQALMDAYAIGSDICGQIAGKKQGGKYNRLMSAWTQIYGFNDIASPARTNMRRIMQNQGEIETWRSSLAPETRMRLNNPQTIWEHFSEWKRKQGES
jgi:hypothetical protein